MSAVGFRALSTSNQLHGANWISYMQQLNCETWRHHPATTLKHCPAIVGASTVYESMISGDCALFGPIKAQKKLKSWTITRSDEQ
jgi:hypothetical protein